MLRTRHNVQIVHYVITTVPIPMVHIYTYFKGATSSSLQQKTRIGLRLSTTIVMYDNNMLPAIFTHIRPVNTHITTLLCRLGYSHIYGASGGIRTPTPFRALVFETSVSAYYTTEASCLGAAALPMPLRLVEQVTLLRLLRRRQTFQSRFHEEGRQPLQIPF